MEECSNNQIKTQSKKEKIVQDIITNVKRQREIILKGLEKGLNESDTRTLINKFFEYVLGYDLFDISSEKRIRSQYADYVIRINDKEYFVVEVKSIGTKLNKNHLVQLQTYAASSGIDWAILTNGAIFELYKIVFDQPVDFHKIFEIDLTKKPTSEDVENLYLLHKHSASKNELQMIWQQKKVLSESNLQKYIVDDEVLTLIAKRLKKDSGIKICVEDLRNEILAKVFRS